jgi:orotate phosphoribosyltransferase
MNRTELIAAIKSVAYLEGDFVLRSGRRSKYYLDKYLFETQPEILAELGRLLAQRVGNTTTRIAGAELGGVPLAAATSMACGKPFVIVRNAKKDYGTSKQFEGKLERGDGVLLVEDVVTTAGQILEAAKTLQTAGATVERVVAVIDRQEGGRQAVEATGLVFESLFTASDLGVKPNV